jgi:DNA-binding transcriptional LysR family regulator
MPNSDKNGEPALDDWNLLRSFIAIYETGTLTEAAVRLNTTQPSMGRHLRELEALINETLFTRLPGKLKPNARADALFEAILPMRLAVREATNVFVGGKNNLTGVVRVAVAETYAYHVLAGLLAPLLDEHHDLEIGLSVSNESDNLLRRDADIAVRFFRPIQDDLVAIKVGETQMGLYAHTNYLARHGEPTDINLDLAGGQVFTGFDRKPMHMEGAVQGEQPAAAPRSRFRTDFALAREAAMMSGYAMAMMFTDIALHYPQLRRVLPERINLKQEVWLCAHEELRRSARMRLVWAHLETTLRQRYAAVGANG